MTPVEILTLVPLATLIVVFGVQPGLLLDLVQGSVDDTLERGRGRRGRSPSAPEVVVGGRRAGRRPRRGPDGRPLAHRRARAEPAPWSAEGGAAH